MTALGYIFMLGAVLLAISKLSRDYTNGVCWTVALMIVLPDELSLPFGVAELTVQRILVLTLLGFWLGQRGSGRAGGKVPFLRGFLLLAAAELVSLMLSTAFVDSVKAYLALVCEQILLFAIIATSLTTKPAIMRAVRVMVSALAVVAALAVVERYTGRNLPRSLLLGEGENPDGEIWSVYRHRIMFGYAMASIFPFALYFAGRAQGRSQSITAWAVLLLTIAACYFSFSRGPWIGLLLLAVVLIAILSRGPMRKGVTIIGIITMRPWWRIRARAKPLLSSPIV